MNSSSVSRPIRCRVVDPGILTARRYPPLTHLAIVVRDRPTGSPASVYVRRSLGFGIRSVTGIISPPEE